MSDFVTALGLLLVIEGVLYALFPGAARRLGQRLQDMPDARFRRWGVLSVAAGVGVVWMVRGQHG